MREMIILCSTVIAGLTVGSAVGLFFVWIAVLHQFPPLPEPPLPMPTFLEETDCPEESGPPEPTPIPYDPLTD